LDYKDVVDATPYIRYWHLPTSVII